jgi:hypothetical protein
VEENRDMTDLQYTTLVIYDPNYKTILKVETNEYTHIPQEGEELRITQKDESDEASSYKVTDVENEFRQREAVNGTAYVQFVYVFTAEI